MLKQQIHILVSNQTLLFVVRQAHTLFLTQTSLADTSPCRFLIDGEGCESDH